jgi:uncharacterized membrane protein YqgA involved in biofilm formation
LESANEQERPSALGTRRFDDPRVPLVSVILALTSTGGVLLLGLGLVLLDLKQVRVVNMLPAVLVAPLLAAAAPLWPL